MNRGDVESVSSSVPSSTPGSAPGTPRNRVKFLCSHGGRILPRPSDGHLKYVGGETRVICVSRDITFSELMKKLISMFDGEMVLKYQLMPEDLDVLVTVKSNEDVRHMIEECDRHEVLGAPRLRAFLFTACPIVMDNHMGTIDHHSLEQRYINSVNGIVVHPPSSSMFNTFRPLPNNTSYTTFTMSSACSSPRTPPETTSTATNSTSATTIAASGVTINNPEFTTLPGKLSSSLRRNRSSPSLCNIGYNSLSNHQNLNPILTASPNLNQPHLHSPLNHHQQPQPHLHHSPKPPLDRQAHKISGPEHVGSRTRSPGVSDYYRHQMDHSPYHYPRTNRGGGSHSFYQRGSSSYDDYYGNCRYDRTDSPPGSPLARSPDGLSPSPGIRSGRS